MRAAVAVLVLVIGATSAVTTPGSRARNSRSGQSIVFPDDSSASVAWSLRDGPSGKLISGQHHLYRSGGEGGSSSHGLSASQSASSSFASSQSEAQSASREFGNIVYSPANEYSSQVVWLPEPEDGYQQTIIHYGHGNQHLNANGPPHAVNLLPPTHVIHQSQQPLHGELISANKDNTASSAQSSSSSYSQSNAASHPSSSSSSSGQLSPQQVPGLIFPGSSVTGFGVVGDGSINHVTGISKSSSESHSPSSSSQSSSNSESHSSSQSASDSSAHVSSAQVPSLIVPSTYSSSQSSSSAAAANGASQSNSHSSAKTLGNGQTLSQSSSHSSGASSNGLSHSSSSSQSSSGAITQEAKQPITFGDGFVPIQQLQVSVPLVDTGLETSDHSLSSFGSDSASQYSDVFNGYNNGALYSVENVQVPTHSYGITDLTNNVISTGPTGSSFSESASQSTSSAGSSSSLQSASESSSQSSGNSFIPGNIQAPVPNIGQLIHILPTRLPHSEKHVGSFNNNAHSSSQSNSQSSGLTHATGDLQLPLQNVGYFGHQISSIPLTDDQSYSTSSSQSSNAASSAHSSSESKSQSSGQHLIAANLQAPLPDIGLLGQINNEQFIAGGPSYIGGVSQSNNAASASQSLGESNSYNSGYSLNGGHLVPIQGIRFTGNLGGNSPIIGGQSHSASHSQSSSASSASQSSSESSSHSSEQALSNGILQPPIQGINLVGNLNNALPTAIGQTYTTGSTQSSSAASSSSSQSASESSAFSTGDLQVPIQLLPLTEESSSGLTNTGAQSISTSGSHSSAGAAGSKSFSQSGSVASGGNAAYSQSSSSGKSVGLEGQQSFSQSSSEGGSATFPAVENGLLVTPANSYSGSTSQASGSSTDYNSGLSANVGSSSQAYTSGQAANGISSSSSSSSSGTYNPSEIKYPEFGKFLPYGFPGLFPGNQQPLSNQLININGGRLNNAGSASDSKSSSFSSSGGSSTSSSSSSASSSGNNIPIPLNGFYGVPVSPLQGVSGSSSFSSSASSSRGFSSSSSASSSSSSNSGIVVKQPVVAGPHFGLPGSLCRFSGC